MKLLKKLFQKIKFPITWLWDFNNFSDNMLGRGSEKLTNHTSDLMLALLNSDAFWTKVTNKVKIILTDHSINESIEDIIKNREKHKEASTTLLNAISNATIEVLFQEIPKTTIQDSIYIIYFMGYNHEKTLRSFLAHNNVSDGDGVASKIKDMLTGLANSLKEKLSSDFGVDMDVKIKDLSEYVHNCEYSFNESNNIQIKFTIDTEELTQHPRVLNEIYSKIINKILKKESFDKIKDARIFCQLTEDVFHEIHPSYHDNECEEVTFEEL